MCFDRESEKYVSYNMETHMHPTKIMAFLKLPPIADRLPTISSLGIGLRQQTKKTDHYIRTMQQPGYGNANPSLSIKVGSQGCTNKS